MPIENASALTDSIENDFDELIDRLQNAKKGDFDEIVFEEARKLIASHHAKFAREGWQIAGMPDDEITAQFLAVAEWPCLNRMLWDLMSERKQSSYSWGWYVTVALQRIHGISPERVREIRNKLRKTAAPHTLSAAFIETPSPIRASPALSSHPQTSDRGRPSNGSGSLHHRIAALAAGKTIR